MAKLSDDEQRAIKAFLRMVGRRQVPTLAVGANARMLVLDKQYDLPTQRLTVDWDFAARVDSWASYEALARDLQADGVRTSLFDVLIQSDFARDSKLGLSSSPTVSFRARTTSRGCNIAITIAFRIPECAKQESYAKTSYAFLKVDSAVSAEPTYFVCAAETDGVHRVR